MYLYSELGFTGEKFGVERDISLGRVLIGLFRDVAFVPFLGSLHHLEMSLHIYITSVKDCGFEGAPGGAPRIPGGPSLHRSRNLVPAGFRPSILRGTVRSYRPRRSG